MIIVLIGGKWVRFLQICKVGSENIDHVLNHCTQVDRSNVQINNIHENDELLTLELVQRVHQFKNNS